MASILVADCSGGATFAEKIIGGLPSTGYYVQADVYVAASTFTAITGAAETQTARMIDMTDWLATLNSDGLYLKNVAGTWKCATDLDATANGAFTADAWHTIRWHWTGSVGNQIFWYLDGVQIFNYGALASDFTTIRMQAGGIIPFAAVAGEIYRVDNVRIGTTAGSGGLFFDDFEGGTFAKWDSSGAVIASFSPTAPSGDGDGSSPVLADSQRVGIAFDDGPLVADPTFTFIDGTDNLVAGYDIVTGKQTELDRTDTGTGTVYLHDTTGDFDPMNAGGAYFGKLVGKQILFQLFNPVTSTWEKQWRGKIRDYNYDIVNVLGPDGEPIVANVQIECVDVFDYLGGYGLQPGKNGDTPPAGDEGIVFYEDTAGTVDDRIIQLLDGTGSDFPGNPGLDSTRYVVFSGNVKIPESKYDPGDAALTAVRDAADAEFPGLANIYVDRFGRFVFHGRRARFDPEGVIADGPVSSDTWDFHRWKVGDGTAITGDSDYAQIRVLGYTHGETDIVNQAVAWPAGMLDSDMPGQVFEDATSIAAHGLHSLPPMGDLLITLGVQPTTGNTGKVECAKFAEFFVHYLKDPQTRITSLMVKAIDPTDARATTTWAVLTLADISDIMRTTVGYPNGTGIDMDNYIEGYTKRVRPLNPTHDYVEVEFNLTPTSWSMDPDMILAV